MATHKRRTKLNGMEENLFKLVSRKATTRQWKEWLRTPLEHALAEGDEQLALALLRAGANGGEGWKGYADRTLLHAAAEGGNVVLVRTVLEEGGLEELDVVSGKGQMTALHRAVAGGDAAAARELMLAGADVVKLDSRRRTALHYAVEWGHLDLAGNLLVGGASPTHADNHGDTPLHLAAAHEDANFVRTLVRRGAAVNVANWKAQLPLHVAVKNNNVEVAVALLKAGAYVDCEENPPLVLASRDAAMTRTLLRHRADVDAVDEDFFTPLHSAAQRGNPDVINVLVDSGADLEAGTSAIELGGTDFESLTPLHVAAFWGNLDIMTALLRRGADFNAKDDFGRTPLHLVCMVCNSADHKFAEAADILLRWGADENITEEHGRRAESMIEAGSDAAIRLKLLLANVEEDRAWRRRGMLVMCRAFPGKLSSRGERGKTRARTQRGAGCGRGSGSMAPDYERRALLARVVELEDNALFRTIVEYL